MKFLKNKNVICGFVLVLFSILAFCDTEKFNISSISSYGNPATVPRIVIAVVFILAALLLLDGVKQVCRSNAADAEAAEAPRPFKERLPELLTFVLLIAYVSLLQTVGFVIMTALYLFLQMYVLSCFEKKKLWRFLLIACIVAPALYYLFRVGFNVFLPAGILNWNP